MISQQWRVRLWLAPLAGIPLGILFLPVPMPSPHERHITVDATQFQFSPSRLEVNYGDYIFLTLTASDVVHGFYLDNYGIEERLRPGVSQQVEFTASQTGKFHFRCTASCGPLHPFMIGELAVSPNVSFWRSIALLAAILVGVFIYFWQTEGESNVATQKAS